MRAIRPVEAAGDVGALHLLAGHHALPVQPLHPGANHRRRYVNGPVPRVMRWATAGVSPVKCGLHMKRRTREVAVAVRPRVTKAR